MVNFFLSNIFINEDISSLCNAQRWQTEEYNTFKYIINTSTDYSIPYIN